MAEARGRVAALFRRQLRQPLHGLQLCWAEFEAWLATDGSAPDANDRRQYEKALERLETLLPLEDALVSTSQPKRRVHRLLYLNRIHCQVIKHT